MQRIKKILIREVFPAIALNVEGTEQHFVWPWPQGQIMYFPVKMHLLLNY